MTQRPWLTAVAGVALSLALTLGAGPLGARKPPKPLKSKAPPPQAATASIVMPGAKSGIGFDDLRFSPTLGKLLVPAGATGRLDLIDPTTRAVTSIEGFSTTGAGITSVDEDSGLLFVSDRTARELAVVAPGSNKIVARAPLASGPDYVRHVAATDELWVTEPDKSRIEVFHLPAGGAPQHIAFVAVAGGPESLVIDGKRGRAYSNLWTDQTLAIDLKKHTVLAQWPNGCKDSRGLAFDEARGLLFVACAEGKVSALDVDHGGAVLGSTPTSTGVDIIDYNAELAHLYVVGARSGGFDIVGVGSKGTLSRLASGRVAKGAHCVVADDKGNAYVCEPKKGRLVVFIDKTPRGGD